MRAFVYVHSVGHVPDSLVCLYIQVYEHMWWESEMGYYALSVGIYVYLSIYIRIHIVIKRRVL